MMRTFALAAALTAFAAGGAMAQEAPYTVMNGQVKHPGQLEWNAPVTSGYAPQPYYGQPYYGGASAVAPDIYAPAAGPSYRTPANRTRAESFYDDPLYNQHGPGAYIFDGGVINGDQDYSGK